MTLSAPSMQTSRYALQAIVLLTPILVMFTPLALSGLVVASSVLLLADEPIRRRLVGLGLGAPYRPLALICLLGGISAFWAVDPMHSLFQGVRQALMIVALLLHLYAVDAMDDVSRRSLTKLLAWAGIVHVLLVLLSTGAGSPLGQLVHWIDPQNLDDDKSHFNRGIAVLGILFAPYLAAWASAFRLRTAFFVGAIALVALSRGMAMSSPLALGGAILAGALSWKFRAMGVKAVYGAFLLLLLILPFLLWQIYETEWMKQLLPQHISWNIKHRLIIWQFAVDRYFEHPLLGWGMDASRQLPGGSASIPDVEGAEFMPLHPHNGFLQIWLELGVAGALCLAAFLAGLAQHQIATLARQPARLGLAVATTAAYLLQGLLSFGVWQSWWLSTALLATTFFNISQEQSKRQDPS